MDAVYPPVCEGCENKRPGKKMCFHGRKVVLNHASVGSGTICFYKALNEENALKAIELLSK